MEKSPLELVCGECPFARSHVPCHTWGQGEPVPSMCQGEEQRGSAFPVPGGHGGPALLQRGLLPGRNAQRVPEVQEHEGGQEWDGDKQDTQASRPVRPQGCSPLLPHLKGLGVLGIHQQLSQAHVMFPGPGNTHTQMLELVITQLQVQPCPIRVGVSQISP